MGQLHDTLSMGRGKIDAGAKAVGLHETAGYEVEDLAAGADIAARAIFVAPYALTIKGVNIVGNAAAAGIDATNTSVWAAKKNNSGAVASKTYNNTTIFPAALTRDSLGAITNGTFAAGDVLTLDVTNGATADTPRTLVSIDYVTA